MEMKIKKKHFSTELPKAKPIESHVKEMQINQKKTKKGKKN